MRTICAGRVGGRGPIRLLDRVRPWAEDRAVRMSRGQKHPFHDFLSSRILVSPGPHLIAVDAGIQTPYLTERVKCEQIGGPNSKLATAASCCGLGILETAGCRTCNGPWNTRSHVAARTGLCLLGPARGAWSIQDPNSAASLVPLRLSREDMARSWKASRCAATHHGCVPLFTTAAAAAAIASHSPAR